ncbi:MAG: hypothetical protein CBD27_08300 [Rhodospirillaceae bacterium TMED167]|jgi:cation transport protein ChaC|nr:gamma-glutamylcyclotransferase [Rhodospirillaceae bacterium]MDG2033574.1 gamma-glutamylcyclotransferase [Rhodospirillales bacterium]OUW26109.1 MAG: hypothetical protein CBD27_08300 [Rhodospirillaceae bacterium TMED167]
MVKKLKITRDSVLSGALETHLEECERKGLLQRSTQKERARSRREAITQFAPGEDIWLFAYGSLLWNPTIHFKEMRHGQLRGYHRRFCLETVLGRGTPENPGLMLALDHGGSCHGIAYRIERAVAEHELKIVWDREMVSTAYVARVLPLATDQGRLKAITFTINRNGKQYAGKLAAEKVATVIARASGPLGNCSEYLFQTIEKMAELDIQDPHLSLLSDLVKAQLE